MDRRKSNSSFSRCVCHVQVIQEIKDSARLAAADKLHYFQLVAGTNQRLVPSSARNDFQVPLYRDPVSRQFQPP